MLNFHPSTAHLTSWTPSGQTDVLWLSENAVLDGSKAIRGGVPICWPWFGDKEGFPSHGFARNSEWVITNQQKSKDSEITLFKMKFDSEYENLWKYKSDLLFTVKKFRNELKLQLTTINQDTKAIQITQALHTYFTISDIEKIRVQGHDGQKFYDKLEEIENIQNGNIAFSGEFDRIYLTDQPSTLIDSGLNRKIKVSKSGSKSTVIWNPWQEKSMQISDMKPKSYKTMVCIEAANTHYDPITIDPGKSHTLEQKIRVERI